MNESDCIFSARYVLGRVTSKDIVKYADGKLTEGNYSDAYLNIVDADFKTMAILAPLLEVALKDSGVAVPEFEEAVWVMLRHHIGLIASGEAHPKKQFSILLSDIERFEIHKGIKEYVGDNVGIALLYGWYYEDYATEEEINSELIKESKNWVSRYGQNTNKAIKNHLQKA